LSENDSFRLLDRLKLAREMVGSVDALDRFLAWRTPEERWLDWCAFMVPRQSGYWNISAVKWKF